jgi:hypothetical protein
MPTFQAQPLEFKKKDGTVVTADQILKPMRGSSGSRLFEPGRFICFITKAQWSTFGTTRKWGKLTFDLIVKNANADGDVNLLRQDYILGEVDDNEQFVDLEAASGYHYLRAALGLVDKAFDTEKLSGRAFSAVINVAGYRTGKEFKGDVQPKDLAPLIGVGKYATLEQIEEATRYYNIRQGSITGDEVIGFEEATPESVLRLKMKLTLVGVIDPEDAAAAGLHDAGNGEYFMTEAAARALKAVERPRPQPRQRL